MVAICPRNSKRRAARQFRFLFAHDLPHFRADAAQIAPVDIGVDIEHRPDVIVVHDYGRVRPLHADQIRKQLRGASVAPGFP